MVKYSSLSEVTFLMKLKKHKRKNHHVVIVTSDAVDANVKQFRIKPWIMHVIVLILCVVLGVLIGYISYEEKIWNAVKNKSDEQQKIIEDLQMQITEYETTIDDLEDKNQILSDTLNQKVETEAELLAVVEGQSIPTGFPLNSSASIEDVEGDVPMCLFTAAETTAVIATASGVVTEVSDDETYGHCIKIDHGNGYVTIYLNKGDAIVKVGEEVVFGTTLFIIGTDNTTLGYQMMFEEQYIDPMDMLAIDG